MTFIVLTVQAVLWFFILYHIFLTLNAKKSKSQTEAWQNHLHAYEISRIEKEESLKNEFSNFLHDDVLQDLFSLKNLMEKSERPEVRELIGQTLENLNVLVREQMQEYHPVLLKSLSLKENYSNLLSAVSQKFQPHDMNMIFDCDNSLFLIMPYDVIIYRMIKVLSTNALKHSLGSSLRIILTQTGGLIDLTVKDNGNVSADIVQAALQNCKGKGLFSIQEQAALLGGQLIITENNPKGLCVRVVLPMKGEGSYEYFIGR
jgi:two-component system secretion system sensor histidine kinase SalK